MEGGRSVGSQGIGNARHISGEEPLRYAIFFENVETATAPAQEVVITDQLDATTIDLSTLSFGPVTFGSTLITPPPGQSTFTPDVDLRPGNNLIVKITASLDPSTGLLTWRFISIDPATGQPPTDPLEGFLPPNVTPPEGNGSVLFTVMPKQGLLTGTEIRNQAEIVFDTNEPILTPEWLNTLDNSKPTSQVLPLASTQITTTFQVQWAGNDVGAGIKDYTVYVSEEGGPFTAWLSNTPNTAETFTGENGKTYAFYSVARDHTNNVEDTPTGPDTTTTVQANLPPLTHCQDVTVPTAAGVCTAHASVDNGSLDPDGDPVTLTQSPAGPYGLGETLVTLTATDDSGLSAACTAIVTVQDTTAPTITSVSANPNTLWPPNHKMQQVTVTASASDTCDAARACRITLVRSNEPENGLGDGDTAPDWAITGDHTVNLRAERSETGNGRVYTMTVACTDTSGNSATGTVNVTVPHNQ